MTGETELLTSVTFEPVEDEDRPDGFTTTRIEVGGNPAESAILNAVSHHWHRVLGRQRRTPDETQEWLAERIGKKVTLVWRGENVFGAGMLKAREGRLFEGNRTGQLALMPKGARRNGYVIDTAKVIDVLDGYAGVEAKSLAEQVRAHFPKVRKLTRERLLELPGETDDRQPCKLALFGTHRLPDSETYDAIWLINSYWPDDDIVEGVLLVRPEHGTSEHGSVYGQQLLHGLPVGEVVDFESLSWAEAVRLCELDFDEASAIALGKR